MRTMTKKKPERRARREFSNEFEADAVRLVRGGKTVPQVADELALDCNHAPDVGASYRQAAFIGYGRFSSAFAVLRALSCRARSLGGLM